MRETGEVRPQSDRLGGIEAVVQSAAGDQGEVRCRAVGRDQRLRRGDPPLGEREGELDFLGPLAPERLHPGEAGAAQSGDVDGGDAGLRQLRRGLLRDTAADFFHDHRDGQFLAEHRDLLDQSLEVMVAFRLQRFLQRVEVQDQRIGPDHLDRFQALFLAHAVVQLDGAEIGEKQDVGGDAADLVGGAQVLVRQPGPLGADAEGDPDRLGDERQPPVDVAGGLRATGHARDQEGQLERLAQKGGGRIDRVQVQVREGLVHEGEALEAGATGRLHGRFER